MFQLLNLEAALQTDSVTESDIKEVIKKQLKDAPKRKVVKKTKMIKKRLMRPMLIKICIVGVIFTTILLLGHYKFIFS